jgi:hypothetical protein
MDITIIQLNYNQYGELMIKARNGFKDISRSGGLQVPQAPFALLYDSINNEWYASAINQIPNNSNVVQIIQNNGETLNVNIAR